MNGFKDAFNVSTSHLCPNGTTNTTQWLDTLGDKIMYPLIYQNLGGTESIYADQTVIRSDRLSDWANCGALVSVQHDGQHNSRDAGAAARLEQRSRRLVSLDAQHQRRLARQRRDRLFHLQHHRSTLDPLCGSFGR